MYVFLNKMLIVHFCPFGTDIFRTKINIYSHYTESVLFKPLVNIHHCDQGCKYVCMLKLKPVSQKNTHCYNKWYFLLCWIHGDFSSLNWFYNLPMNETHHYCRIGTISISPRLFCWQSLCRNLRCGLVFWAIVESTCLSLSPTISYLTRCQI